MTLEQELTALLAGKTKHLGSRVCWLDEIDSTNSFLKQKIWNILFNWRCKKDIRR